MEYNHKSSTDDWTDVKVPIEKYCYIRPFVRKITYFKDCLDDSLIILIQILKVKNLESDNFVVGCSFATKFFFYMSFRYFGDLYSCIDFFCINTSNTLQSFGPNKILQFTLKINYMFNTHMKKIG